MTKTSAAVLLALLVGTGLGYLWGSRQVRPGRADRAPVNETVRQVSVDRPTVDLFLATATEYAAPAGSGTIRGRVRTVTDQPVPGVVVTATPVDRPWPTLSGDAEATPDELMRYHATRIKWHEKARVITRTDAGGAFELAGLGDQSYYLDLRHQDYSIRAEQFRRSSTYDPGERADFVATPLLGLTVDVLLPDGTQPRRAEIHCKGKRGSVERWSPDRPTIRVPPGTAQVSATAGRDDEYRSAPQAVELEIGSEAPPVTLQLQPRPGIRGRVIMPAGLRPDALWIYANRFVGDTPPPGIIGRNRAWSTNARLSEGYGFTLWDLQPGKYVVSASVNQRVVCASAVVEIGQELATTEIRWEDPDPEGRVVVEVYGPEGEKLERVRFRYTYREKDRLIGGGVTSIPRADGSYLVEPRDLSQHDVTGNGTHSLGVESREHGSIEIPVDPESQEPIVIRFGRSATLRVTLEGYVGSGHEGKLRLRLANDSKFSPAGPNRIDADGTELLGPMQPGETTLAVGVEERRMFRCVARIPIRLNPGENHRTVRVPKLYTLKVVGPASVRFQIYDAARPDERMLPRIIGKAGFAEVNRLPAGEYVLWRGKDGERWETSVVVPAQTEVRIE